MEPRMGLQVAALAACEISSLPRVWFPTADQVPATLAGWAALAPTIQSSDMEARAVARARFSNVVVMTTLPRKVALRVRHRCGNLFTPCLASEAVLIE